MFPSESNPHLYPWFKMINLGNTQTGMSVPLRQCLVMSVVYGDSHQLPANLFGPEIVRQVVVGVTGEDPEQLFYSSVELIF